MGKLRDITGQKFGKWTVIDVVSGCKNGLLYWNCVCSCGTKAAVNGRDLRSGKSQGCKICAYISRSHSMIGRVFYKWTVIGIEKGEYAGKRIMYKCECKCGFIRLIMRSTLIKLKTSQCITCHNRQNNGK